MGKTTFTGPIRAGNILNTAGTTLGQDVANVGFVVMVQVYHFTQADCATALGTEVVLPANSHILNIQTLTTTAWNGAATTMSIGTSSTATEISALTSVTVGLASFSPGTDATRAGVWENTGANDVRVWVKAANTGAGVSSLTVRYIQAHDLA
jgi:hypothetical protein